MQKTNKQKKVPRRSSKPFSKLDVLHRSLPKGGGDSFTSVPTEASVQHHGESLRPRRGRGGSDQECRPARPDQPEIHVSTSRKAGSNDCGIPAFPLKTWSRRKRADIPPPTSHHDSC